MTIARLVIIVCFVVMVTVLTIGFCAAIGNLAWMCLKDAIIDWKQYRLKDRVITVQEYNELMDSLQEVKDSMRVLDDVLRAKGLLDSCEATTCSQSELD